MNPGIQKSIVVKKDSRSPYVQADLERLKQYINMPKSKSHKRSKSQTLKNKQYLRKGAKSVLKIKNCTQDKAHNESIYSMKDYTSIQKHNDAHFKSYDVRSSLNKYDLAHPQSAVDMSVDKVMRKSKKKMRSKRNSSIFKNGKEGTFFT